ncbi:MAG: cytoplasmic protein [Proteobacteria bacterium]|nr:cytoplasmic protein [Pseudomonadota bacterium]
MSRTRRSAPELQQLVEEITVDAYGADEQLWAFRQVLEDELALPADAFVIGAPVSVLEIDYDGNERRGLTARCRREDGSEHVVAASDVVFPPPSSGARYLAAYRKWLGIDPYPPTASVPARRRRQHKAAPEDLDLSGPVELVVLSVKGSTARCRLPDRDRVVTLRAGRIWHLVPGVIAVVRPAKQWRYAGHPYLSGEIESTRLDIAALGLVPLRLKKRGAWDPKEEYWGEEGEPIAEWARPIIARGPRMEFEMEQVLPEEDPEEQFSDPITRSNERKDAGDREGAWRILMETCEADLRCLDAHAHLGNLVLDHDPREALRHYEAGLRIGEFSLPRGLDGFDGVLSWGHIDNRPFLRCLHGYSLCLWRLGRFEEAGRHFDRMLWLNPSDNQGVRFLVDEVAARAPWKEGWGGT